MVNENAVALCAYCHDIIGGNANKRKQLKELRDYWYKEVEANRKSKLIVQHYLHEKVKPIPYREPNNNKKIAIYHLVNKEENFIDAANDLFKLTRSAQIKEPNKERILYLDIEGHRKTMVDLIMTCGNYNFISYYKIYLTIISKFIFL